MASIESHAPGTFCWIELGTTDQNAAKEFYGSLFGWTANDFPMGPGGVYTMFQLQGRDCAAGYTLNPEMRKRGVPPHWMLYIATANADETAAKAAKAGGTVVVEPFDVMDFGRMAVIQDPAGTMFSVWQPLSHTGTRITAVPGTLCWADLSTPDQAGAAKFYGEVFGWKLLPGEDASGYLHIDNGGQPIGGVPPAQYRNPNVPPHWLLYFFVEDCNASTAQAKEAGAQIHMGPMTVERVGHMSVLADPQGATFALFQPLPRQ